MKLIDHNSRVTGRRPARNSSATGAPSAPASRTTRRVPASIGSAGAKAASQVRARSRRPFSTRNCSDSGSQASIASASSKGTAPPTKNTARQPKAGISAALRKPPSAAPSVKPHDTIIMRRTRRAGGLNSPTSAIAFGMMQPRPSPVTKRSAIRAGMVETSGVASMLSAKNSVAPISTGRRPIRSASTDKPSAPSSMPNRLALNTGPSEALATPHSAITLGAT